MAKITVTGQAIVITSALKLEDIKMVQKYRPAALVLKGGEDNKEEIFRIGASNCGAGDINKFGATFANETRDENKYAVMTLVTNHTGDGIKEYLADQFGGAMENLNKLEETLPAVVEEIKAARTAFMDGITIA